MTLDEEARRLTDLLGDRPEQLLGFLSGQLGIIKNQSQMLLGLCGLTITVTGFSGAHMIRGGQVSAAAMVLGILLILVGAALCISTLTRVRWVTQHLQDDLSKTTREVLARRNAQQSRLNVAGVFVVLGLAAYLSSVAIAAFANAAAS